MFVAVLVSGTTLVGCAKDVAYAQMNKSTWMFFVSVLLFSCSNPVQVELDFESTPIVLKTNWRYNARWSGTYQNKDATYLFTADGRTDLVIAVCNENGELLFNTSLLKATEVLTDLNSVCMIAQNRFLVLQEHGVKMAIIDTVGNITRVLDLSDQICANRHDNYQISGNSNTPVLGPNGVVYLEADWAGSCLAGSKSKAHTGVEESWREHFRSATGKCKVASLELSLDSSKVSFGAEGLFPALVDTPRCTIGGVSKYVLGKRLFITSNYSNDIMELDMSSLKVLRRIPLSFSHGDIGIAPPPVSKHDKVSAGYNSRLAAAARIAGLAYDDESKTLLASVYHERPESEDQEAHRDWSLLTINEEGVVTSETEFKGDEFTGRYMLSLPSGVWLMEAQERGPKGATSVKLFRRLLVN